MFDEAQMVRGFYESLTGQLKDRLRPFYPELDSLSEEEQVELCLAFNRSLNQLNRI